MNDINRGAQYKKKTGKNKNCVILERAGCESSINPMGFPTYLLW